jgi:ATP synthase protein I
MVRAALRGRNERICWKNTGVGTMSDHPRGPGEPTEQPPDEAALSARLRRLGERIDRNRANHKPEDVQGAQTGADPSAMARGFRLSTELVAGVLVGAAIGWSLDRWLGISPWGLIVFLLLGFAAGVINVMRMAGVDTTSGDRGDSRTDR